IALYPESILRRGLVFYLKANAPTLESIGTGIARVNANRTTAVRAPGLLFTAPEPKFGDAALVHREKNGDRFLYLYGGATNGQTGQPALTDRIVRQVGRHPWGPHWRTLAAFSVSPHGQGTLGDYAGIEHPELRRNHGRTLLITYFHPTEPFQGDLRLVKIKLGR